MTYSSWYQHITEAGARDPVHTSMLRSPAGNKGTQAVCLLLMLRWPSSLLHLSVPSP